MDLSSRTACHVCGKYFYTDVSVKMHITRVHGCKTAQDSEQHVDTVAKKGSMCSVCKCCFPTDRALKLHVVKVHGTAESDAVGSRCSVCSRCFSTDRALKLHVVKVHGAVESDAKTAHVPISKKGSRCSVCNRCCPNDRALKMHVVKVHGAVESDAETAAAADCQSSTTQTSTKQQCTDCGRYFVNLNNHVKCAGNRTVAKGGSCAAVTTCASLVTDDFEPQRGTRSASLNRMRLRSPQKSQTGTTRKERTREKLQKELDRLKSVCHRQTSIEEGDPLLEKLTSYHERLSVEAENILREKLSAEVLDVLAELSRRQCESCI